MSDLEQRVQTLQQILYQEENLDALVAILEEIDALSKEHLTRDIYDLLAHAYRTLSEATSDDPNRAYNLILHQILPWLIASDVPDSADYARGNSRDTLSQWLNQYAEDGRQMLLQAVLDVLANALLIQPTVALCWTISSLGYRRSDLVTGLKKVILSDDDELGNTALRALARLQVQGSDRQFLLGELHRRVIHRMTILLLSTIGDLADVSSVSIMQQYLNHLSNDNEAPFARMLGLGVLTKIADTQDASIAVQEAVWSTIVDFYESARSATARQVA